MLWQYCVEIMIFFSSLSPCITKIFTTSAVNKYIIFLNNQYYAKYVWDITYGICSHETGMALRHVISIVCVTNEREESVVNQHNLFRKMLYSNNETTCFGL